MKYELLSVGEACKRVNGIKEGWFLPSTHSPYVLNKDEAGREYIRSMFESLVRGSSLGCIILVRSTVHDRCRMFSRDIVTTAYKQKKKNLSFNDEVWLVLDGHQRLQTIYSCLKYSIGHQVLIYNLFHGLQKENAETGFDFVGRHVELPPGVIWVGELLGLKPDGIEEYRKYLHLRWFGDTMPSNMILYDRKLNRHYMNVYNRNLDRLFKIFVSDRQKRLTCFYMEQAPRPEVQEVKLEDRQ